MCPYQQSIAHIVLRLGEEVWATVRILYRVGIFSCPCEGSTFEV